jgi:glycosyltransferase involved in cell wall biosynthesis
VIARASGLPIDKPNAVLRIFHDTLVRRMTVVLARSELAGPISGADETLVRYAIRLHSLGYLHSVALLHRPAPDDPYLTRLLAAGIPVSVIVRTARLRGTLVAIRRLAIALGLITDVTKATPPLTGAAPTTGATPITESESNPPQTRRRKTWRRLWHMASDVHLRACRRHFRRCRADVIHVVASDAGAAVLIRAARQIRIPVLFHELGTPDHLPELRAHYVQFTAVARAASEVAALSPALAEGWRSAFGLARPARVLPLLHDDAGARAEARPSDTGVVFGFAARLERGKGPIILLEAFAAARRRVPGIRLRVSGVGPLADAARERAEALALGDSCEFLGYTLEEDKRALLESFDVFVLPTLAEGTPNGLVEVMMLGLPVVTTTVGGIPDMLARDEAANLDDAALLVPPNDVDALADALIRLATDAALRERLGAAARRRYLAIFHPDSVLPLLLYEYRRTIGRQREMAGDPPRHPWRAPDGAVWPHVPATEKIIAAMGPTE